MIARHLAIIGVGLIGGSLARALRAADAVEKISGYDIDRVQLQHALELGIVDQIAECPDQVVADADLIVLAVPVLESAEVFQSIYPALRADAVITDVGSTKVSVVEGIRLRMGTMPSNFVPGHPIAGTEKSGVAASFSTLFEGRRVILTPLPETSAAAGMRVQLMWEAAGAKVECMSPAHHDEILAATSHLPHLLAYALVDLLSGMQSRQELFKYAAGGFRDFTRIAASSPKMWHDIVRANRGALVPLVERYIDNLASLRDALVSDDAPRLLELFRRARDVRERYVVESEGAADAMSRE